MPSNYTDVDVLKASLSVNDDFADEDIEAVGIAASEAIDAAMGRTFKKDLADVTRRYTALDPRLLNIRDLASLTTLKTDEDGDGTFETTWATTDYVLQPINAASDDEPFTSIEVNRTTGDYRFPLRVQGGVQIVGKWGWPSIPAGVTESSYIIANQLLKRKREVIWPMLALGDQALYLARHDPQVNFALRGLGRAKVKET